MIFNKRYEQKEMKGQGGCGTVFEVVNKEDKQSYALKFIKIKKNEIEKLKKEYDKEIEVMKNIKNKYIIDLIDNFYDETNKGYCIVMELCDGNLEDILEDYENGLPIDIIKKIFIQLNEALKTMRYCGFIHRDLKTENILIKYTDENKKIFDIKLSDFGLSTNDINTSIKTFTEAGTLKYMAPEVKNPPHHYNEKCDLWSLGVILYELYYNKYIFDKKKVESPKTDNEDNKMINVLIKKLIED